MAKVIFVVHRAPHITHEEFVARWGDRQHVGLVERVPHLIRNVHNEALHMPFPEAADGIGELWFPSEATMNAAMASPEFGAAVEDGRRFADLDKTHAIVVHEKAVLDRASSGNHTRIIEQHWAYWSAHDLDRLQPLFTEDVVYEDVTMGVVNHGPAQVRAFGEGFFSGFPDLTFELRSCFADGNGAGGSEWIMRGTHRGDLPGMPATGKRVEVRGASAFEFAGAKIRRCSDYWDMTGFLKQLGLGG